MSLLADCGPTSADWISRTTPAPSRKADARRRMLWAIGAPTVVATAHPAAKLRQEGSGLDTTSTMLTPR